MDRMGDNAIVVPVGTSGSSGYLGPTASVDAINSDMLAFVEGYIIVSVSGDLELWQSSEVTTPVSTTVKAGTSLILTKTGP